MKLKCLAGNLAAVPEPLAGLDITGLSADSRAVRPGNGFVAIAGQAGDGAAFIADAAARGAVAVFAAEGADAGETALPILRVPDPRAFLTRAAARLFPGQPQTVAAVTGTAGKTSVVSFTRQIWKAAGHASAMIGTTGIEAPDRRETVALTTPDPVFLHRLLAELAGNGVTHAVMEASSHGLDQKRLDSVRLVAGAFTNLGRDHLDYHPTMEAYFAAKMRLFETLLEPGAPAVIFADDAWSDRASERAGARGLDVLTVGRAGAFLTLKRVEHQRSLQIAEICHGGTIHRIAVPLAGDFQLANALVAAGLAIATGVPPAMAIAALERLRGAPGRLELVGTAATGAPVYVDYAHKPEALEHVLSAVRPFTTGRVVLAFGCGGDRDRGKRAIMGRIAARLADAVIVTDDNPRSEDPAAIRGEILSGCPRAHEIADRAEAIAEAVAMLGSGDTLVVAGKGHEQGQTVGQTVLPFSDREQIRKVIAAGSAVGISANAGEGPLWVTSEMVSAMRGRPVGVMPEGVCGLSIDSRTILPGEAFFAIRGNRFDGHDFAGAAAANGAGLVVVGEARLPALGRVRAPMIVVDDVLSALRRLAAAARARSGAKIIAVTGSVGKTTTKDMLRHALAANGAVHAATRSFNNHWGVPLTLSRMPRSSTFGVFEIGMNRAGEIGPLARLVRPHVAVITAIAAAHLENFRDLAGIARAKSEIFEGLESGGAALLNRDSDRFAQLAGAAASHGVARVFGFGEAEGCDVRLRECRVDADGSSADIDLFGERTRLEVGAPGRHLVANALAVAGAARLVGLEPSRIAGALRDFVLPQGRGRRHRLEAHGGVFTLIDESYNANPASMRAGIDLLGLTPVGIGGRRVAILGDMLELGDCRERLHAGLADALTDARIDLALMAGAGTKALAGALPSSVDCHHRESVEDLIALALNAVRGGDAVMVKASNGLGFARVVNALRERYREVETVGSRHPSVQGALA